MTSFLISVLIMVAVVGALSTWARRQDRLRRERRTDAGHHR